MQNQIGPSWRRFPDAKFEKKILIPNLREENYDNYFFREAVA
jgi:hypothetical protein